MQVTFQRQKLYRILNNENINLLLIFLPSKEFVLGYKEVLHNEILKILDQEIINLRNCQDSKFLKASLVSSRQLISVSLIAHNVFKYQCSFKNKQQGPAGRTQEQQNKNDGNQKKMQIFTRTTKNLSYGKIQQNIGKKGQAKITYYNIIKMLFPQTSDISPLDINVMDTIFYNSDGSMTYVYTDPKRGLIKTKSKNYLELFSKRKLEIDQYQVYSSCSKSCKRTPKNSSLENTCKNFYQRKNQYLENYNYVGLLRYKDQSFIRLKQHQFKSIFIRPVQAKQKYKITNNAHYIQLIPQEVNYQEGKFHIIEFILQRHINTQFFKKVTQIHYEQTSYNKHGPSSKIKQLIKDQSIQVHLFFIILQIYAYVSIHYQKQIKYGFFEFMCVNNIYYLCNTRKIQIAQNEHIQNYYGRANLFDQFVEQTSNFQLQKEVKNNEYIARIQSIFEKQNQRIGQSVRSHIKKRFQQIQAKQDERSSNQIFHLINQKCPHNLHYLFQNQLQYEKFLKRKQTELDGFSPLVSISNISRNKYKKNVERASVYPPCKKGQKNEKKQNKNLFIRLNKISQEQKKKPTLKWLKQTLSGKKQYYC